MNKAKRVKYTCKNCRKKFEDYKKIKRIFCSEKCRDIFYGNNKKRILRNGGYFAIHKWLLRHYGKADKCENTNCEKKSKIYQWALRKDKEYKHKKENFIMLCQNCHRNYDKNKNWNQNISKGKLKAKHRHTKKTKLKQSKSMIGKNIGKNCGKRKITFKQVKQIRKEYKKGLGVILAKKYGVTPTNIRSIIHFRTRNYA